MFVKLFFIFQGPLARWKERQREREVQSISFHSFILLLFKFHGAVIQQNEKKGFRKLFFFFLMLGLRRMRAIIKSGLLRHNENKTLSNIIIVSAWKMFTNIQSQRTRKQTTLEGERGKKIFFYLKETMLRKKMFRL